MLNHKKIQIKALIATLVLLLANNTLSAAENQADNIIVLFSGNVYGEIEPCG